jgi:hypothetical protein
MRRFQSLTGGLAVLALAGLAAAPASTAPASTALASGQHPSLAADRAAADGATADGSTADGSTADRTAARTVQPVATPPWVVRNLAPEGLLLRGSAQAISQAQHRDFALAPTGVTSQRYRLESFSLTGGQRLRGPVFSGSRLQLAKGYAWVYGAVFSGHNNGFVTLVLSQVSQQTLAVVRSWTLAPRHRGSGLGTVAVAPGPGHSVWVGYQRTLRHISTATGATIGRVHVPAGFSVVSLAIDPAHRHLYAGTAPLRGGGAVFEYRAGSGQPLAPVRGRLLRDSVGGVDLTAVPGGVFGLFRTGMLGEVIKLSQPGLRNQPLRGRIFGFAMFATTVYTPGALFLANEGGGAGCVSPGGAVRHTTTIGALKGSGELLAVAGANKFVYGIGRHGLIVIMPPAGCWP